MQTLERSRFIRRGSHGKKYWDDLNDLELDATLIAAASAEEISEIRRMGFCEKVGVEKCLRETGRLPIGTRWVDTNKGDLTNPKVGSRLVAQELKLSKHPELFFKTPPIEYGRCLVSCVASNQSTA